MNSAHERYKHRLSRMLTILLLIEEYPLQWDRPSLAGELEVDKATIQRDINEIRHAGIKIKVDGKQGYYLDCSLKQFLSNFQENRKD